MTEMACKLYTGQLMEAMARLKQIPMSKVVRNAARDFAKAGLKATPEAIVSKSEYYTFVDRKGQRRYLHESQVKNLQSRKMFYTKTEVLANGKKRRKRFLKDAGWQSELRKVRVAKGWSKASWLGIFRALGLPDPKKPPKIPPNVAQLSFANLAGDDTASVAHLTDYIHFDRFGRGMDRTSTDIMRLGFERAAQNMTREVTRMMQKEWRKG